MQRGGGGYIAGTNEIVTLENKCEEHLIEVDAHIYGMATFERSIWFRSQMEYVDVL